MRAGTRSDFLYRQDDRILNCDVEFSKFLATRSTSKVRAEKFVESIEVTLARRYERETAKKLKQIRAAHLAQLRERFTERKTA